VRREERAGAELSLPSSLCARAFLFLTVKTASGPAFQSRAILKASEWLDYE